MNRNDFQSFIRRILNEEVEKSATDQKIYKRLPEVVHNKDYKEITPYKRDDRSKDELLNDMDKLVKAIDASYMVVWDDHDDISITARDLFRIRILPRWENNYDIEAFTRNEDRVYITGQKWDQVKDFVKANLKELGTTVEKAYDKSVQNRKDQTPTSDKGLPQKDKPKTISTDEPPKTTKNKEKNYSEEQVKTEKDLPEKPMQEVKDFKKLIDYKVKDPVKLRKRIPDKKLVVKQS